MADAAALNTCSQLSTTSSSRRPASASATVSINAASPCGVMPSAVAIAAGTDAGSPTGASSTIHTPSGSSPASSAPTSTASRVLPTPPTPLSVTKPVRSHELGDLGHEVLATDERVQLLRQVARRAIDAAKHRELEPQPLGDRPGTPPLVPAVRGAGARPTAGAPRDLGASPQSCRMQPPGRRARATSAVPRGSRSSRRSSRRARSPRPCAGPSGSRTARLPR